MRRARSFAFARTGNNIAARMAMMAMTTSSSISVKPRRCRPADPVANECFIFIAR